MSLTQEQFLIVADTNPNSINIWYSDSVPLTIFGLTVPILDNTGINTIQLLQTAQQINITINGYNYTLDILNRAERTASGTTYYFFDINDIQVNSLADDTSTLPDQIIFLIPGFQNTNFFGGDYDVLLNNVENSRQSSTIMLSDRYKISGGPGSLNPINIGELRNLTAERADVQDSNYTTTGWINGRYEGSKTNSITYGGVDSAVTGKFFEGSLYPSGTLPSAINQQVSSSITIYTQYLSTSDSDLPTFPTILDTKYLTVTTIGLTDTQIQIQTDPAYLTNPDISIGDIITINNTEYMRVANIQPFNNNQMLTVTRRWNGSPGASYLSANQPIKKIKGPTKIYQLQGNKIQGLQRGRLVVKDTQETLIIDVLGQVVVA